MMTLFNLIANAAAAAMTVAAPAPAAPVEPPVATPAAALPPKPTRYCVISTPTGTHIPRKYCQTRQRWLDEGFDPTATK
ncbi:MAG TPA: hypothetical protein VFQ57_09820 [Sphingomonas sp.]|jgi:hypothetical protein|nr:hypothetical protein [Sphingomonas sp.]